MIDSVLAKIFIIDGITESRFTPNMATFR